MPTQPRVSPSRLFLATLAAAGLASVTLAVRPGDDRKVPFLGDLPVIGQMFQAPGGLTDPSSPEQLKKEQDIYRQHIFTLANPFFEGRCPGTRGNADAADYIEFWFQRYGLEPAFKDKDGKPTFFQPFVTARMRRADIAGQTVSTTLGDKQESLTAGDDFAVLGSSESGSVTAPIVFAGYAIENGKDGYNSFAKGADLKGKIALVFRFEPMNDKGKSKWVDETEGGWSEHAGLIQKIRAVKDHGAAAVIVMNPPGASDPRANRLMRYNETSQEGSAGLPVVMITPEACGKMLKNLKVALDVDALRARADAGGELVPLGSGTATVKVEMKAPQTTNNVAAILKGKGPLASEYVGVGSHYDHVGYGEFGSLTGARGKIHPGADDNASGTSGTLTLASRFAEIYKNLPSDANCRSIVFFCWSGEESGLEGSAFYCRPENMIAPVKSHYFYMNMDMIGRLRDAPPLEVTGMGTCAALSDWLQPYFDKAGFPINPRKSNRGDSDHASFFAAHVPDIFFFTGTHPDYHTPNDTADKINIEGAVKVLDLCGRIALDATTRAQPMPFAEKEPSKTETKPEAPKTDSPAPERRARPNGPPPAGPNVDPAPNNGGGDDNPAPARAGGGIRFGIQPADYGDDKPGVLVGQVYEGTPAAKAGLKEGDRMTKWNGKDIKDVAEWTPMLRAHKPGDKVKVTFVRDNKEQETEVTLEARTGG